MFSVLVFMSCVFTAWAAYCCVPPQFEGQTSFVTTIIHENKPHTAEGSAFMAYDSINHIVGQIVTELVDGKETSYGILMDYNAGMKYIVKDQKCLKIKLKTSADLSKFGCIAGNATDMGANNMYGLNSNVMDLRWYQMDFGSTRAYVGVTADDCVPAMEVMRGDLGGDLFLENVHYFNMSAGLSHPESLKSPPVGCENAPLISDHFTEGHFAPGIVGRRRSIFGL